MDKNPGKGTSVPTKNQPKNYFFANAESFKNNNEKGTAVYLGGKEVNGKIEIEPKCIRNAVTGRAFTGLNQFTAQQMAAKANIKENEIATYDQIHKTGSGVKKNQACFYLAVPGENGQTSQEMYFFKSAALDVNKVNLAAYSYKNRQNIIKTRQLLENEKEEEKINKYLTSLAYMHRDELYSHAIPNSEDKYKAAEAYIETLPENEKEAFTSNILKEKEVKDFVDGYDQKTTEAYATKKLNSSKTFDQEQNKTRKIIDATHTSSATDYLGKYLAASTIGAVFITDKESQNAVQKELNQTLSKAFAEHQHKQAYLIGSNASERCVEELKSFQGKSYEQQHGIETKREQQPRQSHPSIDSIDMF